MRGKKAKAIRKLVKNKDPRLLIALRNVYGEETEKMNEDRIYKLAKKLFKENN